MSVMQNFNESFSFVKQFSLSLAREAELRRLRKANIEFEEQNAVLQRHIKDMYNAKERLEAELGLDEKRTQALHQHLLTIKHTLVNSLSSIPLPGKHLLKFVWLKLAPFTSTWNGLEMFYTVQFEWLFYDFDQTVEGGDSGSKQTTTITNINFTGNKT